MPTLYTSDEIAAAAKRIGLDGQVSALLCALQGERTPRYLGGNAQEREVRSYDMASAFRGLYDCLGTWQAIGDVLEVSRAYAWRVAHRDLVPSAEVLARYEGLTLPREATL